MTKSHPVIVVSDWPADRADEELPALTPAQTGGKGCPQ